MSLRRLVEPEWLDILPAAEPRAVRSRRDLARVNRWMMQRRIMIGLLLRCWPERGPRTILELGAGDGTFMLSVAHRLAHRWPGVKVRLLDRQAIVSKATLARFHELDWSADAISDDAFSFLERNKRAVDLITANLFLHHFHADQLAQLFSYVAKMSPTFVATEPRRFAGALYASRLLWAIGCNEVSRHDASTSVRAGFNGNELSQLWPDKLRWDLDEGRARPFTHWFMARRKGDAP
jgi:hypothetical protein